MQERNLGWLDHSFMWGSGLRVPGWSLGLNTVNTVVLVNGDDTGADARRGDGEGDGDGGGGNGPSQDVFVRLQFTPSPVSSIFCVHFPWQEAERVCMGD